MLLHLWMAQAAAAALVNGWLRSGDSPGGVDSEERNRTQRGRSTAAGLPLTIFIMFV
jgi:hypothetical protein